MGLVPMKRASGSVPEARGVLTVDDRLPPMWRSGVGGGGLATGGTIVRTVVGSRMRSVVRFTAVAVAVRLLMPRVDVSAAGADTAGEEGAVVVLVMGVAFTSVNQRTPG